MTVFDDITEECQRQYDKWGVQNHSPAVWLAILVEEVGEVAQALLVEDKTKWREELVQVAAVVVTTIKEYDNGKTKRRETGQKT